MKPPYEKPRETSNIQIMSNFDIQFMLDFMLLDQQVEMQYYVWSHE